MNAAVRAMCCKRFRQPTFTPDQGTTMTNAPHADHEKAVKLANEVMATPDAVHAQWVNLSRAYLELHMSVIAAKAEEKAKS